MHEKWFEDAREETRQTILAQIENKKKEQAKCEHCLTVVLPEQPALVYLFCTRCQVNIETFDRVLLDSVLRDVNARKIYASCTSPMTEEEEAVWTLR